MANDSLHVGLIGCGRWGRNILRDLIELGCEVTVVDPAEESRGGALSGGATEAVQTVRELSEVDGIVVASPTTTHMAVLGSINERNIPVYIEKPLTNDPKAAQAMAARAPQNLFVMDKWRYHPGIECLREVVKSQRLGEVRGLRTTRTQNLHQHEDVDPIWILAPHDLSIIIEILGCIPAVRSAVASRISGVPCGLIANLGDSPWCLTEVSGCHSETKRAVHVYCEQGMAALRDPYADHVELTSFERRGGTLEPYTEKISIDTEFPLRRELKAFLAHIHGGPAPKSSITDAAAIVSTIAELRACAGLTDD